MNHTPAPWGPVKVMDDEFFMRTNHRYAIQGGACGVLAKVEGSGEEYKANAQLIAAAPDMLAALESIAATKDVSGNVAGWCQSTAQQAINKARGEDDKE